MGDPADPIVPIGIPGATARIRILPNQDSGVSAGSGMNEGGGIGGDTVVGGILFEGLAEAELVAFAVDNQEIAQTPGMAHWFTAQVGASGAQVGV